MHNNFLTELNTFLNKASKATYAAGGKEVEPWRQGFHELEYKQDSWEYRDSYTGHFQSWGEEVIWHDGKVVWTALYGGGMQPEFHGDTQFANQTFQFLKAAMLASDKLSGFQPRGPKQFHQDKWDYQCDVTGDISKFSGHEAIRYKDTIVFTHDFFGGLAI